MGAYLSHTEITTKGFLGILLVVGGSFSYAMERIQNGNSQEKQDEKGLLEDQKMKQQLEHTPKDVEVAMEMSEEQELLM